MFTTECYHKAPHGVNHSSTQVQYHWAMGKDEGLLAESIGDRIKRLREAKGWTSTKLAAEAGLNDGAIRKVESGGSTAPSLANGVLIADALGVHPRVIAFGDAMPLAPAAGTESRLPEDLGIAFREMRAEIQAVLEMAKTAKATADEAKRLASRHGRKTA